ncbi:MAG: alpha/beta hydrolase [Polyangiaceae bacterium]|nr:alpha/beta hydrolase [Polyangiaceae bacterium]
MAPNGSEVLARRLEVSGAPARVFVGGSGPALLLLHGGWAGAQAHWSRVWSQLARRHQVIAPDLPGLGEPPGPGLGRLERYVAWLEALLDALGIPAAWCVGNSFGASLAWSFAGRRPLRCLGIVLVDGVPMPRTPAAMRWVGERPLGRALVRAVLRRVSYTPRALGQAFADTTRAPAELRRAVARTPPERLEAFVACLVAGDGPPAPRVAPLLVWGERDRLPGTSARAARRLRAALPGATLCLVPDAGHFPQLEQPDEFVAALESFVAAAPAPAPPAACDGAA